MGPTTTCCSFPHKMGIPMMGSWQPLFVRVSLLFPNCHPKFPGYGSCTILIGVCCCLPISLSHKSIWQQLFWHSLPVRLIRRHYAWWNMECSGPGMGGKNLFISADPSAPSSHHVRSQIQILPCVKQHIMSVYCAGLKRFGQQWWGKVSWSSCGRS